MKYVVKEHFREVVTGTRTYTVEANSPAEAWDAVLSGEVSPDSETANVEESDYDMVSAFVVET